MKYTINSFLKSRYFKEVLFFLLIAFVYFYVSLLINKGNIFGDSHTPYYNYLLDAFLNKSIFINNPPTNYDLSLVGNKLTMYWGISPLIFIAPFRILLKSFSSDIFYTLIAVILNVIVFYFLLRRINVLLKINNSRFILGLITLLFAFVSPNFYLSMSGRIWHTNQIISILFLLTFLLFLVNYFLDNSKIISLIFSSLFFGLSIISRNLLVIYGVFYFYLIYFFFSERKYYLLKKSLSVLLISMIFFATFFVAYNYVRFGNFLETGISYQLSDPRFVHNLREKKIFSIAYFRKNVEHYFLSNLSLTFKKPHIFIDPEGNSVFSTYPFTILFLFILQKIYFRKRRIRDFIIVNLIVMFLGFIGFLFFIGTGWTQFGSRYFFDVIPPILFILFIIAKKIPRLVLITVLLWGFLINYFGALAFFASF